MPYREQINSWSISSEEGRGFRFRFQGQEEDAEMWGGAVAFKYRVEDARLGRFFSVDPLTKDYPWNSTYAFAENRTIDGLDLEGAEWMCAKALSQKTFGEMVVALLSWSDVNDATVLATTITRGEEAINFDGSHATSWDKGAALAGIIVPLVAGSVIAKGAKLFGLGEGSTKSGMRMATNTGTAKKIDDILQGSDDRLRKSFAEGRYDLVEAAEDITVYRISGGSAKSSTGSFFSATKPSTSADAEKMLNINTWDNTGKEVTPVTIKRGTQFAFGKVEGGTGSQIYIPTDLQNSGGNEVIRHLSNTEKLD